MPKPQWSEAESVADNARVVLPPLAESYFDHGRKLLAHKRTSGKLHRFRLKTKKFRYTLELFRDVYGPSLKRRLELLRPIQSALGDINDCAATLELLDRCLHKSEKPLKRYFHERAEKKTAEFEEYWRNTFDAPGQSEAWVNYLTRFAGRKGA